eukprot:GHVL01020317.1.p2 GENE.GHVL01020317.1~~GHVL01020317.1.p2  ORF type:complete len:167 (-),score=27.86 GHVL01020317.1:66-566(-)
MSDNTKKARNVGGFDFSIFPFLEGKWSGQCDIVYAKNDDFKKTSLASSTKISFQDDHWEMRTITAEESGLSYVRTVDLRPLGDGQLSVHPHSGGNHYISSGLNMSDLSLILIEQPFGALITAYSKGSLVLVEAMTFNNEGSLCITLQRYKDGLPIVMSAAIEKRIK